MGDLGPIQRMFSGSNSVSIDNKGRMVMPNRYRERLQLDCGGRLVVTVDRDQCLIIFPQPIWEAIAPRLMALPTYNEQSREMQRFTVGYATEVELDGQGRLLLPPSLRKFAQLKQDAMLVGQGDRFELWDEALWEGRCASWLTRPHKPEDMPAELKTLSL